MSSVFIFILALLQDMSENSGQQLLVKARFNFQQTNEDELTFTKGNIISVTRQEEGGWWEGILNGKTGWFPSNYVREIKGSGRYHKIRHKDMGNDYVLIGNYGEDADPAA